MAELVVFADRHDGHLWSDSRDHIVGGRCAAAMMRNFQEIGGQRRLLADQFVFSTFFDVAR